MPKKIQKKYTQYQKHDPQYARECDKYPDPLPSREYIMSCLDEMGEPLTAESIIAIFNIEESDRQESFHRRLMAMARQGQLIRNRRGKYALVDQLELIRGRVIGHKDGFGFLKPDDNSDDLFIPTYQMRALFPGDIVLARVANFSHTKREAVIVEVLERANHHIVGRYVEERNMAFVQPYHKQITQDIVIPNNEKSAAINGQYVITEITEYPTARRQAMGRIVEIIGDHLSPGMEIEVALRTHHIPNEWPADVLKEIAHLTPEVTENDKKDRQDIRDLALVTIDGEDAKDFDDAVYCDINTKDQTYRLVVAIADVSHYVKPESPLDQEAFKRGNSVYFPGRVVPMLPEILSNELCSLKPHVDRLCMVCDMRIDYTGMLIKANFYDAVMCSKARLTYMEVSQMLAGKKKKQMALLPHLKNLESVYQKMLAQRATRGALDFETTETRILFGKNKKIEAIVPVERTTAHRIIEECMLMANVATAQFLKKQKIPTLYRVHKGPNPEKIENLKTFIKSFGLKLTWTDEPTPHDYQTLIQTIVKRPDAHLIQTVLLRSLMQAIYSPELAGHFGLAYDAYLHFTSPIRRYPDLLVHRGLRYSFYQHNKNKPANNKKNLSTQNFPYDDARMAQLAEHCSITERRADEATRDAVNWLKCYYMQDKLGQAFEGIITGVTGFGVFVELKNIYVEGLLHITSLKDDYYHYDPVQHVLKGKRTNTMYRLGDSIQVIVARANPEERELDFELAKKSSKPLPKKIKTPRRRK